MTQKSRTRGLVIWTAVLSAVLTLTGVRGGEAARKAPMGPDEIRAIWVTRWDYRTPEDVKAIIRNCADYHFNVVLFQVRGNGTVFYKSNLEPWAWELTGESPATTGKPPGWDPLKLACREAHRKGVELHAYMNVFPGWRGQNYPPVEARQLWTAHPDWFMVDRAGQKMIPRTNWYSFLCPGIPEVQKYLVDVFLEVVKEYRIDGIHFDYIRYPSEIDDFSYDPVSLARFKQETGKIPQEATPEWAAWRAEQVTQVEQAIYCRGKSLKPKLIFSASVVRDPERGQSHYYQDSARWMKEGTIDIVMPMLYTNDMQEFREATEKFVALRGNRWVCPGISIGRSQKNHLQQIELSRDIGANGSALFAYSSLFSNHVPNEMAVALLEGPFWQNASLPWQGRGAISRKPSSPGAE